MTDAPNQQANAQNQSGGTSLWKWLLGCGCLTIMLVLCTGGVAVVGAGWYLTSTVQQMANAEVATQEQIERRGRLLEAKEVDFEFDTAVTASEFDGVGETVTAWKNSEAVSELMNLARNAEDHEDQSMWKKVQMAYKLWRLGTSIQDVGLAYIDSIEGHGGMVDHYRRFVRTGAVLAAVHEVASGAKFPDVGSAQSDEVAELLYEQHDRVVDKYASSLEELRGQPLRFEKLAEQGDLGKWALAQLPADSYRPWHAMSPEEREAFTADYGWAMTGEALAFRGEFFAGEVYAIGVN